MLLRLIASAGLVAIGYYVGRQVGRMEPVREELARARDARLTDSRAGHEHDSMLEHQGGADS